MAQLRVFSLLCLLGLALAIIVPEDGKVNYLIDDIDDSLSILFTDVPMSRLVRICFNNIPQKYREKCLLESFERFAASVFPMKSRCCTKWAQMSCIERYAYNSLYCDMHQRSAVSKYFAQVRSLKADGSPECTMYRPAEEEKKLWSSGLGRTPQCALD